MTLPVISYVNDTLNSSLQLLWYDKNSNAKLGVGFWRPRTSNSDLSFFGDRAIRGWTSTGGSPIWAVVTNDDPARPAFAKPADFRLIWQYCQDPFAPKINSIWEIIPPSGYVALGSIATQTSNASQKPGPIPNLVCVRQDLTIFQEELPCFVWDDQGSGLSAKVGVWGDDILGHMFAVPNYDYPVRRVPYRIRLFPATAGDDLAMGMPIPERTAPDPVPTVPDTAIPE